jgi:hypothetical protein
MSIELRTTEVEQPPETEHIPPSAHSYPALLSIDQVIAHLFPAPTVGQLFSTRFRERASREQTILPDEPADVVAICTKSIATLAKELGLSFDTTQKYVVLYKALGLMKKRKVLGKLAFVMGTGIYHPPNLLEANLHHLLKMIKGRHKFRELVGDVLARCKVYGFISQEFQAAAALLQELLHPQPGETRRTLEQRLLHAGQVVNQVLSAIQNLPNAQERKDTEWFHLPGNGEAAESTQRVQAGRRDDSHFDRKPPQSGHRGDSAAAHVTHESPQTRRAGRFGQEAPVQNLPNSSYQGDSAQPRTAQESTLIPIQGRFEGEKPVPHLPPSPIRVDSSAASPPKRAAESTQTLAQGRFEGKAPTKNLSKLPRQVDSSVASSITHVVESTQTAVPGRFDQETAPSNLPTDVPQVDSSSSPNVNVILRNKIVSLNVNVREVVEYLRIDLFNEPSHKRGYYYNLYNKQQLRNAEAWLAATIETLIGMHQAKTVVTPGSYFFGRCVALHQAGIPPETAELVQRYGSLSYAQLLEALSKPASSTPPVRGAPLPSWVPPAHVTPSSLSPLPRWGTVPRFITPEHGRPGMSREEARQLAIRAQGDRRIMMCRVDLEKLADGSYAVLLDNTITTIPRQTYFYSVQEWETRSASIQDCFELFGVARSGRRCLADALKERRATK